MRYDSRGEVEKIGKAGVKVDGDYARVLSSFWVKTEPGEKAIAPCLKRDGFWEAWVTVYLSQQFDNHEVFVDVGSNVGYYTLLAAQHGLEVHAFEPNVVVADLLEESLKRNDLTATVHRVAASDASVQGKLTEFEGNSGSNEFHVSDDGDISGQPLDGLKTSGDILFKVDVEGHEQEVWNGMQKLWRKRGRRTLVMEWVKNRYENPRVFAESLADGNWLGRVDFNGMPKPLTVDQLLSEEKYIDVLVIKGQP